MKPFAICSNNECDFSIPFATDISYDENTEFGDDFGQDLEKRLENANTVEELASVLEILLNHEYSVWHDGQLYNIKQLAQLPDFKFCELCGSDLLFYCPHCKKGFFSIPLDKRCGLCGKKVTMGALQLKIPCRAESASKYDGIGTKG